MEAFLKVSQKSEEELDAQNKLKALNQVTSAQFRKQAKEFMNVSPNPYSEQEMVKRAKKKKAEKKQKREAKEKKKE